MGAKNIDEEFFELLKEQKIVPNMDSPTWYRQLIEEQRNVLLNYAGDEWQEADDVDKMLDLASAMYEIAHPKDPWIQNPARICHCLKYAGMEHFARRSCPPVMTSDEADAWGDSQELPPGVRISPRCTFPTCRAPDSYPGHTHPTMSGDELIISKD
jgi:hypothetical protein